MCPGYFLCLSDPPLGLETFAWEEILAGILLPVRMPEDCVLLRSARRTWKPRPAVQLPLTVQDASGPGADWLAALREQPPGTPRKRLSRRMACGWSNGKTGYPATSSWRLSPGLSGF